MNILFVNDGAVLMADLKEMLINNPGGWRLFFAEDINRAGQIIGTNNIDVLIAEINNIDEDSRFLLDIKHNYPQIVRIILSDKDNRDLVSNTARLAHQYLEKPYNSDKLHKRIEKTFFLNKYFTNPELIKIITSIDVLPSFPRIYQEIESHLVGDDFSTKKIADLIAQDISLSSKVLQLINSPYYGARMKVSDLNQAVSLLGIQTIKSLVLYTELFSSINLPADAGFSMEEIWRHSLRVARNAREIARQKFSDIKSQNDAYFAGLLHDAGKFILGKIPNFYRNVTDLMIKEDISIIDAEIQIAGTSHGEAGAYLFSLWGLSEDIVEAVAFHHNPSKVKEDEFSLMTTVHIANAIAHFLPYIDLNHIRYQKLEESMLEMVMSCVTN